MRRVLPLLIALAAMAVACNAPSRAHRAPPTANPSAIIVRAPSVDDPAMVVILGESEGRHFVGRSVTVPETRDLAESCGERPTGVTNTWQPTRDVVLRAEQLLPPILTVALSRVRWGRASHYHRQYAGIEHSGRRLIYINGVGSSFDEIFFDYEITQSGGDTLAARRAVQAYLTDAVTSADSGAQSWGVVYDPLSERFGAVSFNCSFYGPIAPAAGPQIIPPQ